MGQYCNNILYCSILHCNIQYSRTPLASFGSFLLVTVTLLVRGVKIYLLILFFLKMIELLSVKKRMLKKKTFAASCKGLAFISC